MILCDRRTFWGLLGAALVSVGIVPFLLRAEDPDMDLRRRRIAGLTQAERERIERNFQRFEAMSEAERQHLREFAAALQADRANNRGRLSKTLETYADWLKTVTPHQRDALQQQQDPTKRVALIRDVVEAQRDERLETRMGGRFEQFFGPIPALSREDLEAMLAIIERKSLLLVPSRQARERLEEYPGIRRSLKLFEIMARSNRSINELLTEATSQQLLDVISDEQTRRELETIPDSGRPTPVAVSRRLKLGMTIQKAIFAELDQEHRRRELTPENLKNHFDRLPREDQDELLALSPDQFQQELRSRYIESEWTESPITLTLIRQFFRPQRPGERSFPGGPRREGRDNRPVPPDRRTPGRL